MNQETKTCQNCKKAFTIEPEDFNFYEKVKVPPPTWCPECRAIRRLIFWNEHNLFHKKDARTGKEIFSTYPEEANIKIYDHDYWWSDAWDPMDYGKDVDFSRPFLAQLKELNFAVPWASRSIRGFVNSDYCNQASYLKNCYLCFNGNTSENCLYCVGFIGNLKDTIDVYAAVATELCYEGYQLGYDFECFFCSDVAYCRNVWFSRDCVDCNDCFGCVNLRHKKYCIWNEQYTKEEYEKKIKTLNYGSHAAIQEIKDKLNELYLRLPHKYYHGLQNKNVTGDYIYNAKNSYNAYEIGTSEDVRYVENLGDGTKDAYDYTNWGQNCELMYESISCGDTCRNVRFCFDCWPALRDSEYCLNCHSSSNLFGCVGLLNKEYCILNKQYTKGEYESLREKIINHMNEMPYTDKRGRIYKYGEFFPLEFSPLAYNDTKAIDYYPKTKAEALAQGYSWREPNPKEYETTIKAQDLPDHIKDVKDDIIEEIIQCASCKRAYRILDREFQFYRRFEIPLPRLCHLCRYNARLSIRNPRRLYHRICGCAGETSENGIYTNTATVHQSHALNEHCPNEFETSYAPDRPEIVYCEGCYNAEVA